MNTIINQQIVEEPEVVLEDIELDAIPETEEPEIILEEEPEESEETIEYNTKFFQELLNAA